MLAWQLLCIFLLLLGLLALLRGSAFRRNTQSGARWPLSVLLLRLSAAGTGLYIMDEYLTPRSLSTPAALFLRFPMRSKEIM